MIIFLCGYESLYIYNTCIIESLPLALTSKSFPSANDIVYAGHSQKFRSKAGNCRLHHILVTIATVKVNKQLINHEYKVNIYYTNMAIFGNQSNVLYENNFLMC